MNGPFTSWVESWIASSQVLHDKRRTVPHPGLALGLASVPGGLRSTRMNEELANTRHGHWTWDNVTIWLLYMNVKHGPIRIVRCKLYAVPDLPDICELLPWCDPFICGELPVYEGTWAMWAIIHHMKISHGPTAVCSQIRAPKRRLNMIRFDDQSANPFPSFPSTGLPPEKKGFIKDDIIHRHHCPLSIPVPQ